jgi:hypothetical protein
VPAFTRAFIRVKSQEGIDDYRKEVHTRMEIVQKDFIIVTHAFLQFIDYPGHQYALPEARSTAKNHHTFVMRVKEFC